MAVSLVATRFLGFVLAYVGCIADMVSLEVSEDGCKLLENVASSDIVL